MAFGLQRPGSGTSRVMCISRNKPSTSAGVRRDAGATHAPASGPIRSFREEDIPQVADLHRRVFDTADHSTPELLESYRAYLTDVYLKNSGGDDDVGSLVHQEGGKITGFLGVVPRRMSIRGQSLRAVITTNFVVDAGSRGLAGIRLLRAVLDGPQDLSIADESNIASRVLWETLGGTTSLLYSMHWLYPLRPSLFGLLVAKKKKLLPRAALAALTPAAWALDAVAASLPIPLAHDPSKKGFSGENMSQESLAQCLSHEAEE